jgi:hypothetical protein
MKLSLQQTVESGLRQITENPKLLAIGLIFGILVTVIEYAIMGSYVTADVEKLTPIEMVLYFQRSLASSGANFLISVFFYGLLIKVAYDLMKGSGRSRGRSKGPMGGAFNFVTRKYIVLLFAYILSTVFVVGGLVLLIIPGIYIFIRLMFFPFAIIVDDEGVIGSLKKSWKISENRAIKLFGILTVIVLIMFGIALVLSFLTALSPFFQQSIVQIVVYAIEIPWVLSSMMFAYMKLRKSR